MSEIEQLTKQKEEIEASQATLKIWCSLKKNLTQKFKNPSEAFKALKKEGKETLSVEDFAEFSKGLDLTTVFKDTTLNEENFIKCWEQWEYQAKQNEHRLQMIEEKLELLNILEQKDKDGIKQLEAQKNKKILNIIQNCDNLDQLQEKLDTLVQGGQQQQKEKTDIIQNESECFNKILQKKSEIKPSELSISKLQQKQNPEASEDSQIQNKKKKVSYLDGSTNALQKSKINLNISSSQLQTSRLSAANQNKQSFIYESQVQISPTKGQQFLKNPPITQQQQLKSPNEERESERRSHKSNRMRGDLQSYISELFHNEREQSLRQEPRFTREIDRPSYSSDQKGLSGFPNFRKYFKNQQQQREPQQLEPESTNISKRLQNIRYKLDDFQNQKLTQYRTKPQTLQDWSPEKPIRLSQQKPKQGSRRSSPQYTPGNTHRLNLDKLRQEKQQNQGSGQQEQNGAESGFLNMEQLNQTLK
ncbi:unnamed protein product (macronuclear) [Paramecium tetraurelia]|uniref:EF-hand domain-containing protein n=1 Tax=Paramecium tetraurelia TaxID=5888 RepID=A0D6Q1_PARTE|nr:uncharacterized protein GSPATT00001759001 [Paramecium tetraurelia]CAK78718.1 unnamed protein product [Paramecium tetraurelia]|eukprot:XP_001446115.1 hypothetical protein (macronuclear) [Paramecium tetraurelia strain d4-2]